MVVTVRKLPTSIGWRLKIRSYRFSWLPATKGRGCASQSGCRRHLVRWEALRHRKWKVIASSKKRQPDTWADGYDTIVGNALAKNVITVGAMRDLPEHWDQKDILPTASSSFGPADDGRIKPDVVANGEIVFSTTVPQRCENENCKDSDIDERERYGYAEPLRDLHGIAGGRRHRCAAQRASRQHQAIWSPLLSHEMRAVLIHTAIGRRSDNGPTYDIGWGSIQALAAGNLIVGRHGLLERRTAVKRTPLMIELDWADQVAGRITITWLDRPKAPVAEQDAVLNDRTPVLVDKLVTSLVSPSGRVFHPWSLDPTKPGAAPRRDRPNTIDNVHRIDVPFADQDLGTWRLTLQTNETGIG